MSDNVNNTKRAFRGVWIPARIWLNKKLTLTEKALLVEINSLDNDDGCYASNEYLAEFLNTSVATITRSISKLKIIGDIYMSGFDGRQRILKVKTGLIEPDQKDEADNQNDEAEKSKRPSRKRKLSKSSYSTITKNSNIDYPQNLNTDTFKKAFADWLSYKAKRNQSYKDNNSICILLKKLSLFGEQWSIARIEKSIMNNYSGLIFDNDKPPEKELSEQTRKEEKGFIA